MIGVTLTRYLAARFAKTILSIFFTIFCLMFVVVFVEMLRRASDSPDASAKIVALITLMKVPAAAEAILPFAVLFGSMAAFVDLTRKLELIVARAAGMSVWQFLFAPVMTAFVIGAISVGVYNPLAAMLKQQADQMEVELFGVQGSVRIDHGVWLRQHGVDGLAVIHATGSAHKGTELFEVSVNVYSQNGGFIERVEAARGYLEPGVWVLNDAVISAPGQATRNVTAYMLATSLTPEQAAAVNTPPQSTPFWSLSEVADNTADAGLDATAYRLQYQALVSRPVLLVAMVLLAAAFSLRFSRMGGVGTTLSSGVASGFVLYIGTKVLSDLGGAGLISPFVAAWSPAIVGVMIGALILLYQEDG